jgi:hypothetical protein
MIIHSFGVYGRYVLWWPELSYSLPGLFGYMLKWDSRQGMAIQQWYKIYFHAINYSRTRIQSRIHARGKLPVIGIG